MLMPRYPGLHEYFGVDLDLVWGIIAEHLGPLNQALRRVLSDLPE